LPAREVPNNFVVSLANWGLGELGTHTPADCQFLRHGLVLGVLDLGFILSRKPWEIGPERVWRLEIFTPNLRMKEGRSLLLLLIKDQGLSRDTGRMLLESMRVL
jgi:hypothetical protein